MEMTHIFGGDPLDRAERERDDPTWVEERLAHPDSRFLAFSKLNVAVLAGSGLAWLGPDVLAHAAGETTPVLLGTRGEVAYFGVDVTGSDGEGAGSPIELPSGVVFENARGIAAELPLPESGMLAHAKAMVDWHSRHRYCANCGAPTRSQRGGKQRVCDTCRTTHFPRTDPVVIMVVTDGKRCLLGRNARRVTGFYSALAGFIDQGESIEEAVRREVREEAGIRVGAVRYHSSQPWPFPSSLMIGCIAEALTTAVEIDTEELADARWFSRAEVLAALDDAGNLGEGLRIPGPIAIAHHLIKAWVTGAGHDT